jgi:hypothetical protein
MGALIHKTASSLTLKRTQTLAYFAVFIALGLITSALGLAALPGLAENTRSRLSEISYLLKA